jgi:hypothetical protein
MRHFPLSLPFVVLAAVALTGCGDDSGGGTATSETTASAAPSGPDCTEIWSGETLPKKYDGCVRDSELVEPEKRSCSSGQVIITYDDRYYAVPGGPVNDVGQPLEDSEQYRKAIRHCGG